MTQFFPLPRGISRMKSPNLGLDLGRANVMGFPTLGSGLAHQILQPGASGPSSQHLGIPGALVHCPWGSWEGLSWFLFGAPEQEGAQCSAQVRGRSVLLADSWVWAEITGRAAMG